MKGLSDPDEEAAAAGGKQNNKGAGSLKNLHYPAETIKEESDRYRSFDGRRDSSKLKEESVVKEKPLLKQVPRRKIYHH